MRTEAEVRNMLKKFDDADDAGELDCDGESIQAALLWTLNHRDDDELTQYLSDEEN
jgi:hypothetical protein